MGTFPFSYDEFSEWFDEYERKYLEPAREAAVKALNEHLDTELREIERIRVKVSRGRVKGKERTWRKLELPKYSGRITALDEIPRVIDDLIGLRVTCNNKSDVQRVMDIIGLLETYQDGSEPVLAQEGESLRDYLKDPKESGYRAIHVNLCTSVPSGLSRKVVTCELQVRTLLQDGWGELTHEDTYKPGSIPPALVETLSRRMADLLATVDDIAQDLRQELDRLSGVNVEDSSEEQSPAEKLDAGAREAAMRFLQERIASLTRSTDLASLAWEMRREFGQEVSQGWFGSGSFKTLLKESVPDARVTEEPPSYVLPRDYDPMAPGVKPADYPGIPTPALALKGVDPGFPLISSGRIDAAYKQLSTASQAIDWNDTTLNDIGRLNEMTRRARDLNSNENPVSRTHLDYIAKSLLFSGNLNRPLTRDEIKVVYVTLTVNRIRSVLHLSITQEGLVRKWLR